MKVAVLSGKGGTGKTLVSVNLAAVEGPSIYMDCDVEEPNGHLFFKPEQVEEQEVSVLIPQVMEEHCKGCRKCVDFCKFNAIAFFNERPVVFTEVCHSCGGCVMICPEKALIEGKKPVGKIKKGKSQQVEVVTGILNVGEASGVPIIKKMLQQQAGKAESTIVIDCPPGSACIVMESIKDVDFCILVAEPTIFGVHNLSMVYELVSLFQKPFGVVLNKCTQQENPAELFCKENNIRILGSIPFDHHLGQMNGNGEIAVRMEEKYKAIFSSLLQVVKEEVQHGTISRS